MKWFKTIGLWVIGTPLIVLLIFLGVYRNLDFSSIISGREVILSNEELISEYENCGYYLENDNSLTSTDDDSYFYLPLPENRIIREIQIEVELIDNNSIQIYYSTDHDMKGDQYLETVLTPGNNHIDGKNVAAKYLRFDLTDKKGQNVKINRLCVYFVNTKFHHFLIYSISLCIIYIIGISILLNRTGIKKWLNKTEKRKSRIEFADQIIALAVSDFKSRFSGSYLGILWGIIQPLSTILLFWFVFQVGFRSNPVDDVPFILWLTAGMIPWNYFYDAWFSGTNSFTSYSYIVKKIVFKIEYLPLVKVLSSSIINLIFNGILILIYLIYRRFIGVHILDMIYFSGCIFILTLSLSYITATLNVFMKDVGQFMGIALQFLMWMTPMMWPYTMLTGKLKWIYLLNPLHYIINGYRESLISGQWFFHNWKQMLWFWFFTISIFVIGRRLMYKLKDHFADVL